MASNRIEKPQARVMFFLLQRGLLCCTGKRKEADLGGGDVSPVEEKILWESILVASLFLISLSLV